MLKKTAAILILGIFLFNWFGYRIVTIVLQEQATALLEISLDNNNYRESQLISIKIPANLPYYIHSTDYERVDGEITVEGHHYNFVKRRLFKDSLELLCIPNEQKTKLAHASDEFYKNLNDLQQPSQNKKTVPGSSVFKNLLAEYCKEAAASYLFSCCEEITTAHAAHLTTAVADPSMPAAGEPPEA